MKRMFVASSKEGIPQVEILVRELQKNGYLVRPWFRNAFESGKSYLESLQEASEKFDFAVIVLRPEDEKVQRGKRTASARDNCVFEAGLFIGALKRDRVFLVSSLRNEELPSDLFGIKLIDGDRPAEEIAQDITLQATEPYYRPDPRVAALTYAQLLDLEAALSSDERVVVQSGRPLELGTKNAANSVRQNMEQGVYYHYFFHADANLVDTIALLCKQLAMVDELSRAEIMKNLELMRKQLRIHLMPKLPLMEFCIHDLLSEHPRLYLRHRERGLFYLWSDGSSAEDFARDVLIEVKDAWDRPVVFSGTALFDLKQNPDYRDRLLKRCLVYFEGECQATAADYLFGPP